MLADVPENTSWTEGDRQQATLPIRLQNSLLSQSFGLVVCVQRHFGDFDALIDVHNFLLSVEDNAC